MQLEKAKETKQDMERCRLLAQRIAEELAPATAAVLNAETPALEKALHRAGVDANPFTAASAVCRFCTAGSRRPGAELNRVPTAAASCQAAAMD